MVLRCAVARVGDLVGLDDEAERVADEERQHDRHQDHRGFLAALPEVQLDYLSWYEGIS